MNALYAPKLAPDPTHRPILVQMPTGEFWASKKEVEDFCDRLWDAAAGHSKRVAVKTTTLADVRSNPGTEGIVEIAGTNSLAFRIRCSLEKIGYVSRTKKLAEGSHAVYAMWPAITADEAKKEAAA